MGDPTPPKGDELPPPIPLVTRNDEATVIGLLIVSERSSAIVSAGDGAF
jgi:hypothetical protein